MSYMADVDLQLQDRYPCGACHGTGTLSLFDEGFCVGVVSPCPVCDGLGYDAERIAAWDRALTTRPTPGPLTDDDSAY